MRHDLVRGILIKNFKKKMFIERIQALLNLKIQRFSVEKYDLLVSFLGQLKSPETSIRVDLVSRTEFNLRGIDKHCKKFVITCIL